MARGSARRQQDGHLEKTLITPFAAPAARAGKVWTAER
jgi:hypothetical protein